MNNLSPSNLHSPAVSEPAASPFVAMNPSHRFALVSLIIIALLGVGLLQWWHPSAVSGMEWVYLAFVGNGILLLLPVIFYRPSFGWFHPLVFALFFAVLDHLRRFNVYVTGLPWHAALPGWSSDSLTMLL
ncbi:MAG: hypothetical protein F6K42_39255, partial [Leptolyngbya sp. SIO1D8]|nr:hypothetical protein [Leptolyngbya sp. SIO1D8]